MRSRAIVALASALGSLAVVLALAAPAAATVGPPYYSPEQAGYVATGARFQLVQSEVRLPNAANFATEVADFGVSVQLWTRYRVLVMGVSNSTTAGNYHAAVAIFNRRTHALICSTAASGAQRCPHTGSNWTNGSVSFPPGDNVMLDIVYDRATGRDNFFVQDLTAMVALAYHGYAPGTGQNYRQARVGAEFAASPWGSFSYTPAIAETHLVSFLNNDLGTYSGHHSSFASWWTRHKILATSNGSSTGTVEVRPHNLYHFGANFGVYLQPRDPAG
jgi:hypothetical protein